MRQQQQWAGLVIALMLAAGAARAGEIVVIDPARTDPSPQAGGVIVVEPGRPVIGPVDNRANLDHGQARAKSYSAPAGQQPGGTVIVVPGAAGAATAADPARDNAAALDRNRARAQARAKGAPGTAGQGTTVLIMPQGGQVITGGPDHGHPGNATNIDINQAKAKAYMEGQGGQRLGCSSSNVTIGTVGGTALNGNQTTIVTDGVNAWAVGPNCN